MEIAKHGDFEFDELFEQNIRKSLGSDEVDQNSSPTVEHHPVEIGDEGELDPINSKVNLENFTILKLIGKGAYGKVYQVMNKDTSEVFAMKVLRKDFLIKTNNVESTKTEKDVLRKVRHPFIVSLLWAFQNESRVYLVMDFVNGGHILFHLREQAMFSESVVKFYAAEVILALEHLHNLDIIHRDLKPENILIDSSGHLLLTDFGFAKESVNEENQTRTFCGTLEYMSPEMMLGNAYGKETDWWSVGILLYDMLTGEPPFRHKNEGVLHQKILKDKLRLPTYLSSDAHSIVKGFLNRDVPKRLGSGPNGIQDIKKHPFFKGINWKKLLNKEIDPPFKPNVPKGKLDISNFDEDFTKEPITDSPIVPILTRSQEKLFEGFSYCRTPTENTIEDDDEE